MTYNMPILFLVVYAPVLLLIVCVCAFGCLVGVRNCTSRWQKTGCQCVPLTLMVLQVLLATKVLHGFWQLTAASIVFGIVLGFSLFFLWPRSLGFVFKLSIK